MPRKIERDPALNPKSPRNFNFLVTGHYGARTYPIYHGDNENKAIHAFNWYGGPKTPAVKRKPGQTKLTVKFWDLRSVKVEEK